MKKILVIGSFMLMAMVSFASGPALKDCKAASATVVQSVDLVNTMSAIILQAVVFYELPFAGTIPNLVTPIESAMLSSYVADIWHPPVLSASWLSVYNNKTILCSYPLDGIALNCRSDKLLNRSETILAADYPIAWYDIA